MEQRNGRIDRHGQKAKEVLVYHFVGKGYKERERRMDEMRVGDLEADLEFLMRAVRKVEAIREDLGKVGPVIAEQVEEAMLGRRTRLDTRRAEGEAEPVRKLLKFERDLKKQIDQLMAQLNETQREPHLEPENIQKVVEVALELAGQPPLIPAQVLGIWPDPKKHACPVFRLPALSGSWGLCSEGLMHPHTQQVRPFVFNHNLAKDPEKVVLVHLNHRLVQMSLRLLRAEVWSRESKKGLKRITARLVPDHVLQGPAMIAQARLVVIGGDCHRLHEEIITAGGLFKEGRLTKMNVGQVEDALEAAGPDEPTEAVKAKLFDLWPKHAPLLAQFLEARMRDRTDGLQKALAERAKKEVADITAILTELRETIEEKLDDPELNQPVLFPEFSDLERQQYERNVDALRASVRAIPEEIEKETAAIRARFADPEPRMFPVAVTYLIPEKMSK